MSRTIFARCTVLAATAALAMTACGGAGEAPVEEERDGGASTSQEESAQEDSSNDTEGSEAAEGAEDAAEESEGADAAADEAAGDPVVVEIGTEFTDEETGDVLTIVSAVRNNPTEYYMANDNPDGEMIYLEVAVTPGDVYGGVVSQQDFYLDDGGEEANYASSADDEMIAAGYEYFDGAPRRDGEATGFIPMYVETTGDTLKGVYVRPEMKILGSDETVPEFRGEFEIPAA